jgi:hypothetical protein
MLVSLPRVLRRAGLTAQAERIEQDVRIRIGDWPTLVVEPDGRVREARPSERPTAEERRRLEQVGHPDSHRGNNVALDATRESGVPVRG